MAFFQHKMGSSTASLAATCLDYCELSERKWEYFLQKLSLLKEGNSTLKIDDLIKSRIHLLRYKIKAMKYTHGLFILLT